MKPKKSISAKALQAAMSSAAPMSQAQMRRYINRIGAGSKSLLSWVKCQHEANDYSYFDRGNLKRFSARDAKQMMKVLKEVLSRSGQCHAAFFLGHQNPRGKAALHKNVNRSGGLIVRVDVHITKATRLK